MLGTFTPAGLEYSHLFLWLCIIVSIEIVMRNEVSWSDTEYPSTGRTLLQLPNALASTLCALLGIQN